MWDFGVYSSDAALAKNMLKVTYWKEFSEDIQIQYMIENNKFYIIEKVSSPKTHTTDYERVWILDQVQNRPYFMRVTFYSLISEKYHVARSNSLELINSICALKNLILGQDRNQEMPIVINTGAKQENESNWKQNVQMNIHTNNMMD